MSANAGANRVLFDEPGPRGRRNILIGSIVAGITILALIGLALWQFGSHGQLAYDRWRPFAGISYVKFLAVGARGTFLATAVAAVVSFPLGLMLALGRISRIPVLRQVVVAWIEVFRSIPMLLVVYAFLLALPRFGLTVPIFWMLVGPMILVSSATTAEVFRAGINAVPGGQSEAAASLGLSRGQALRHVILPQSFRLVLPNLLTQLVSLLKDSTLGYIVSYPELMQRGRALTTYTGFLIQTYLIVAVVYVVLNYLLTLLARRLEARMQRTAASAAQPSTGQPPAQSSAQAPARTSAQLPTT